MFCNDNINVVGMYYRKGLLHNEELKQNIIPGKRIILQREPNNNHDPNAVKVFLQDNPNDQLGYIKREIAAELAPILDRGSLYKCYVQNTYRPRRKFEIVINLTTFPVPRPDPRPHGSNQPVIRINHPRPANGSPTGKAFRKISDFEKYRQKFNGKSGIYVIWNKSNKCCYVGQASDISRRWSEHYRQLSSRIHQNNMLQYDWTTLGSSYFRFDLLEETTSLELDPLERSWIARLQSFEKGYNTTPDGQRPEHRPPQTFVTPDPPPVVVVQPPPVIDPPNPPIIVEEDPSEPGRNQIDEPTQSTPETKVPVTPVRSPTTHREIPPTKRKPPEQEWQPVQIPSKSGPAVWFFLLLVFVAPILLLSIILTRASKDTNTTHYQQQQQQKNPSIVSPKSSVAEQASIEPTQNSSNSNFSSNEETTSLTTPQPLGQTTTTEWRTKAGELEKKMDWPGLLNLALSWSQAMPGDADARYNIGLAYGESGQTAKAIEFYQQAVRINSEHVNAWYNLGVAYGNSSQSVKEIEAYQQATRINPEDANAWYHLGHAYGKSNQTAKEVKAHLQTIRINPEDAGAWNNLGVAYTKSNQLAKAIEAHQQAIRINPEDTSTRYFLGVANSLLLDQINKAKPQDYSLSHKQTPSASKEATQEYSTERSVNLEACLDGHFPMSCKKEMLTSKEAAQADAAEKKVNLETCLDGSFSLACKRGLLTSEELIQVVAAEQRVKLQR